MYVRRGAVGMGWTIGLVDAWGPAGFGMQHCGEIPRVCTLKLRHLLAARTPKLHERLLCGLWSVAWLMAPSFLWVH